MTMATRYFIYRGFSFRLFILGMRRDDATDATATSVASLRRWPRDDLLPPLLIERKRFIALRAHRLDSPCNGGPFYRPSRFWKTSCCVLFATRKIFGVLSIHYGFTFLLRNLSLSIILFFLNFISFSFPPEGSLKISLWRKRKQAYLGNGKCFFRSAEQSGVVGRDPIEIGRCSAKRLLISVRQTRRVRLTIAPFPAGMHSGCRKFAIKSLIH